MRRRLPRPRYLLAWAAVIALPLLLSLAVSYALSVWHYRNETQSLAEGNAKRVTAIVAEGRTLLEYLAQATGGQCSEFAIAEMDRAVFQSVHFREAGIEQNRRLLCTSFGTVGQPMDIENSLRKPAAVSGRLEILSPTQTLQGGQSIILNYRISEDRSNFVNLLLNPQELVEALDYYEGQQAVSFLDDAPNHRFIALDSAPPSTIADLKPPLTPGVYFGHGGLYAIARSADFPLYTVVTTRNASIRKHWRTQMRPAVFAGFLLTGLAIVLLRRFLPREKDADDLRAGIDAGEMEVWYQPIHDARDRRILGAEALVRWRHPRRGLVMPDSFIPLAEQTGLIEPMTEQVLAQVRGDLHALHQLPEGFRISINLARQHLSDDRLLALVDRTFGATTRLDNLSFEITERELLANVAEQARKVVVTLTERGADVALDDFGTGYSGLSHLRHLPLHYIKIDRSFVWAMDTEAVTATLVDSIISLARSLQIDLIAEGVETEGQREHLLKLGVVRQQGWLYGKAMPFEALRDVLAKARAAARAATE